MKTTNRITTAPSGNGHTEAAKPREAADLGRRDRETIDAVGNAVWAATFAAVDAEPDISGQDAGKVAAAAEAAAREALRKLLA